MLDVANDPDDFHPAWLRRKRDIDPPPQRILIRPVPPCGGRIDDDNIRRAVRIAISESTTANERDAEGREVVGAHEARTRPHRNWRWCRSAFDPESGAAVDADERQRRRQRRGLDVRQRADSLEQRLVELQRLRNRAGPHQRRDDDVLRFESGRHVEHASKADQQQARADKQHQRQRELRDNQHGTHARAARGATAAAPLLVERRREPLIRSGERRNRTEDETRADRHAKRDDENPTVEADLRDAWQHEQARRQERTKRREAPRRNQKAGRAADRGEQHALRQQLADQAAAARADRQSHGDLPFAARGTREQQHRDVGARDQQHESDGAQQHQQRRLHVADHRRLERIEMRKVGRVRLRILLAQSLADGIQIGACLLERHGGLQPADDLHRMLCPAGVTATGDVCEQHVRHRRPPERRGQYADHVVRVVVQRDLPAHD